MAELASKEGVKIHTNAQVTSIKSSSKSGVESVTYTDRKTGESHTVASVTDVVITAGPWTPSVWPDAPISALRAHSVTLKPTDRDNPVVSPHALFTHIAYKSINKGRSKTVTPEIYPRPDGTLYACGEGDHLIPLPATADLVETSPERCQDIVDHISSVSDTMATSTITARNACYLPQNEYGGSPLVSSSPLSYSCSGATSRNDFVISPPSSFPATQVPLVPRRPSNTFPRLSITIEQYLCRSANSPHQACSWQQVRISRLT